MMGAALPGLAGPRLDTLLLLLGMVAVAWLLWPRRPVVPAVALAPFALPPAVRDVVLYLRARNTQGVQAHQDNPVLQAAVAAGGLQIQGLTFGDHGALALYRVPDALWQGLPQTPLAAIAPWLRLR